MKKRKPRSNQKVKRKSAGTNKGTSGAQTQHYANLFARTHKRVNTAGLSGCCSP